VDKETLSRIRNLSASDLFRLKKSLKTSRIDGYSLVARALKDCGAKRISSLGGASIFGIMGASVKCGIRAIGTRRGFSATIMAGVDNYISGKLVHVACVPSGPGVTEAVTGVLVARDNNYPLLVVGCCQPLSEQGSGSFQELDGCAVMKPVAKWTVRVTDVSTIMSTIHQACELALDGVPGPVYVEVPEDLLSGEALPEELGFPRHEVSGHADKDCIEDILHLLQSSRRPLLCLGEDLRWGYSKETLEAIVTGFQVPFMTTPLGRGLLPEDHPLCANSIRRKITHRTDCFILAGAWFDWRLRKGSELPVGCKVVHVHPDPELLGRNVPAAVTCRCQPMPFLEQLKKSVPEVTPNRNFWIEELSSMKKSPQDPLPLSWKCDLGYVSPRILFPSIRERLHRDHILCVDGSILLSLASHYLDSYLPFSRFDPGRNGCIGSGIAQAMGACLAQPDRQVVALVGDTGFGMSGMELETAVRHGMNLKVIIANNSGNSGAINQKTTFGENYPERVAQFQDDLPYDKIAMALGVPGWWVEKANDLDVVLDAAFSVKGPSCVNVRIDPDLPFPVIW